MAANVDGERIDRHGVPKNRRDWLAFSYAGVPERGFEISLTVESAEPVEVTVQDISEGLPKVPGLEIEPREPWMMPLQTQAKDPTRVEWSRTRGRPMPWCRNQSTAGRSHMNAHPP